MRCVESYLVLEFCKRLVITFGAGGGLLSSLPWLELDVELEEVVSSSALVSSAESCVGGDGLFTRVLSRNEPSNPSFGRGPIKRMPSHQKVSLQSSFLSLLAFGSKRRQMNKIV